MAWDIAVDLETGDWLFGPTRDLVGVTGPELDKQRINIRVKIPRGSFAYDDDDTLGSRLHEISRHPTQAQTEEARAFVLEALSDMEGISIDEIQIVVLEDGQLLANVMFHQTSGLDPEEEDFTEEDDIPQFDARVTID